jgi:hypothetical protein
MSTRTAIRGRIALAAAATAALAAVAMPTAAYADGSSTPGDGSGGLPPYDRCIALVNLLANPGFESGAASWTVNPGVINTSLAEPARSGTHDAWLDGYGTTHTDSLAQTVTIPSACAATLSFWLHIDSAETTTTTAFDQMTVKVNGTTVATYSNLNRNQGYVHVIIPLTGVTGNAAISFTGTEDPSLQTSFVVDDTAVTMI